MIELVATYSARYLDEAARILRLLDIDDLESMAESLAELRARGGRLFFMGVGGSASNASHATNDFRKIAAFEAYSATDNVAELTARINDDGWASTFSGFLEVSRLNGDDGVFVLSVGGGDAKRNISPNLVSAVTMAKRVGATVYGIIGRDGGHTALHADHCIVVPTVSSETVTPHTESFQGLVLHLLVSHPLLQRSAMKWESVEAEAD